MCLPLSLLTPDPVLRAAFHNLCSCSCSPSRAVCVPYRFPVPQTDFLRERRTLEIPGYPRKVREFVGAVGSNAGGVRKRTALRHWRRLAACGGLGWTARRELCHAAFSRWLLRYLDSPAVEASFACADFVDDDI